LPFLAAIGLVSKVFGFFVKVVIGSVAQILGPLTAIKTGFVALSTATGIATGPLLLIVGAIAAVIAILVLAYKNSEAFRTALSVMADILKGILMGAFNDIKAAVESVMPTFSGLGEIFGDIGDFLAVTLVPILTVVLGRAFAILSGVIQFLIFRVAGIIDAFKAVWMFVKGILQLLTGNVDGATESFRKSFSSAFSAIRNIIKSILAPLAAIFNAIADAWNNSVGKLSWKVPKWVPFIGGNEISAPKIPRISIASFADGGVVFPQDGGVLARVAEAGKPERIEPLDPNGLSARDKAIIDRLSGPGTTVNITVNPSEGMDERELAAIVSRQIAFATRRGAA
jgi:hypothetical protein